MEMFDLLETIASAALATLALATATIVVVGGALILAVWSVGALARRARQG